jgi:hypothetical protein
MIKISSFCRVYNVQMEILWQWKYMDLEIFTDLHVINAPVHERMWFLVPYAPVYVCMSILLAPERLDTLHSCLIIWSLFIIGRWWMNNNFLTLKYRKPSDGSRNINTLKVKMAILSKTAITLWKSIRDIFRETTIHPSHGKACATCLHRLLCNWTFPNPTDLSLTYPNISHSHTHTSPLYNILRSGLMQGHWPT